MSGIGVRITTKDTGVLAALANLALAADDKAALFDEIGINLAENARLRFSDQRGPDGVPWVQSHRARLQGGETLRDTGVLMNSITHGVLSDGVEYGTNVPYALPLHFGAVIRAVNSPFLRFKIPGGGWVSKKEVTLPARPFLGLDSDDEQMVVDVIKAFLEAGKP